MTILEVFIYTDKLHKLNVHVDKLFVDSEIFIVPTTTDLDKAYVIIDSARAGVSFFFKIEKLGGRPEIAAVDTDFERPLNIEKSYKQNSLIGMIN
jgi:hypothetical protein